MAVTAEPDQERSASRVWLRIRLLIARAAGILPIEQGFHAQIKGTNTDDGDQTSGRD